MEPTIFLLLLLLLIYGEDHHHQKISCGYIITGHNSTPPTRREKMKPIEIRPKRKKLISILFR
jgi:hypothetical protein